MGDSIEWFGATTFRLKLSGVTIFLDTWLERPKNLTQYLSIDDVTECDYICISHAHFDHLPGADRIAKQTGASIIANGEAINVMREAGVPENQLVQVAGGERIPLFSKSVRDEFAREMQKDAAKPAALGPPPQPDPSKAALSMHVWPSLHCLMPGPPGQHPESLDTGTEYVGSGPYSCTRDITMGMRHGLLKIPHLPKEVMAGLPKDFQTFADYLSDPANKYSDFDGGQLMFNLITEKQTILCMTHLGGYTGLLQTFVPKPDIVILGIAGRGNIDGRPFDGTAARCAADIVKWLREPEKIIWCLHDEAPIPPYKIDTTAATALVEKETKSRVWRLEHAKLYNLS